MKKQFSTKLKKIILGLMLGFVILFLFRLAHGYTKPVHQAPIHSQSATDINYMVSNYASKSYKVKSSPASQAVIQVDQKYEKIADILSRSSDFEHEDFQ